MPETETTRAEKRKAIQRILGVTEDGLFGPETQGAFEALHQRFDAAVVAPGDRVDDRSERNIATLLPEVQPKARALIKRLQTRGHDFRITSGTRSYDEQNALYEQGRTKPGSIVTNARAGFSNHNFGVAFDITLFRGNQPLWESPAYDEAGQVGKELGLEWGGDWNGFRDKPHFQLRPEWARGMKESQMLAELRSRKTSGTSLFA